jgi:streptogramin lyase
VQSLIRYRLTSVWFIGASGTLDRVDPATDQNLESVRPQATYGCDASIAAGANRVWLAEGSGNLVVVDADTARIVTNIELEGGATGIAFGAGAVWVLDDLSGTVSHIDPKTYKVAHAISISSDGDDIAAGAGAAWVLDTDAGSVTRIDAVTFEPDSPIRVGGTPVDLAVGLDAVWVANQADETVSKIDPITARAVANIPIGSPVAAIAVDPSAETLWLAIGKAAGFG